MCGDKQANIVEVFDNLIVAIVPPRYDLLSDTTISIMVSNRIGREISIAEKTLSFTYYVLNQSHTNHFNR